MLRLQQKTRRGMTPERRGCWRRKGYSHTFWYIRLISALLSDNLQVKSKLAILEDEYNIPINRDFREEVNTMCNLAEGIEERAIERTQTRKQHLKSLL